jgi:antitoxin PrlF
MIATAVVSEKGQVTLPKRLRDQLGIQPGSRLSFSVGPDGALKAQLIAAGSGALFGLLAKAGEPAITLEEMDVAVTKAVQSRAARPK